MVGKDVGTGVVIGICVVGTTVMGVSKVGIVVGSAVGSGDGEGVTTTGARVGSGGGVLTGLVGGRGLGETGTGIGVMGKLSSCLKSVFQYCLSSGSSSSTLRWVAKSTIFSWFVTVRRCLSELVIFLPLAMVMTTDPMFDARKSAALEAASKGRII